MPCVSCVSLYTLVDNVSSHSLVPKRSGCHRPLFEVPLINCPHCSASMSNLEAVTLLPMPSFPYVVHAHVMRRITYISMRSIHAVFSVPSHVVSLTMRCLSCCHASCSVVCTQTTTTQFQPCQRFRVACPKTGAKPYATFNVSVRLLSRAHSCFYLLMLQSQRSFPSQELFTSKACFITTLALFVIRACPVASLALYSHAYFVRLTHFLEHSLSTHREFWRSLRCPLILHPWDLVPILSFQHVVSIPTFTLQSWFNRLSNHRVLQLVLRR